jgi:serine/arginine repetitive matrix protein 2
MSFAGFESFAEVRRGYEFNPHRPGFYPPPSMNTSHGRKESVFSIASVSDYGMVINPGLKDPFDFGMPPLTERPSSENMSVSMSMTVDDTFSFLNKEQR